MGYAGYTTSRPLRVLVVCNSDVAWSRTETEYWASLRVWVSLSILEMSFGTDCLQYSGGADYWKGTINGEAGFNSRAEAWEQMFSPIAIAAKAHDAQAIFWGPATPTAFRMRDERQPISSEYPSGRSGNRLVQTAMCQVRGWEEEQQGRPFYEWSIDSFPDGQNGRVIINDPSVPLMTFPLTAPFGYTLGRALYHPDFIGSYPGFEDVTQPISVPQTNLALHNVRTHNLWRTNNDLDALAAGSAFFTPLDSAEYRMARIGQCLTGRIGKPVWHTDAASFNAVETQAETRLIIDQAIANEGTIAGNLNKPIWIGVYQRNDFMSAFKCIAALDMFKRAGFTDVKYYTRSIGSTVAAKMTAFGYPPAGAEFDYASLAGNTFRHPAFVNIGYAFTNQSPGSLTVDSAGISGVDLDEAFSYQAGSSVFMPTSNAARHVMRCLSRTGQPGGVGGHGSVYETSAYGNVTGYAFSLLQGATLAEAVTLNSVGVMPPVVFGDPLYAPFGAGDPLSTETLAHIWGGVDESVFPNMAEVLTKAPVQEPDTFASYRASGPGIAYRSRTPQRSRTGGRPLVRS